jgi:SagB-type dehydrogenase family enzyme
VIAVRYHDSTKHHFNRFARSLGYLDWATQPNPFRRYDGAPLRALSHAPLAGDVPYAALYTRDVVPQPITEQSIGEFFRCSMGLSAWKEYGQSRWALRVNPSSGNLHPTETWIIQNDRVCHYAPREHGLEERCVFESRTQGSADYFLVALTSIIWREAWKYGERAFRYCQHDTGHAIGALRFAAAMLGWRMQVLPEWSDAQIATLLGLDREADFGEAEHEEPECVALVTSRPGFGVRDSGFEPEVLVDAARNGSWFGRANPDPGQVDWPIIDGNARDPLSRDRGYGIRGSPRRTTNLRTPNPDSRIPVGSERRARHHPPAPQRARF